jgi:putative ATP-binding cassette transporter
MTTPDKNETGAVFNDSVGLFLRNSWGLAAPYFTRANEVVWSWQFPFALMFFILRPDISFQQRRFNFSWQKVRLEGIVIREKHIAWMLLASNVTLALFLVYMTVLLNYWNNEFYNSLQNMDGTAAWRLILLWNPVKEHGIRGVMPGFCEIAVVWCTTAVYAAYLNQWLQIRWRTWMTKHFVDEWLSDLAYYRIAITYQGGNGGTDNPDQRISEDLLYFVVYTLSLTLDLMSNVVTLCSFIAILWTVSGALTLSMFGTTIVIPAYVGYMVWVALAYAFIGTWLAHKVGSPLSPLRFIQQKAEADYRFALARVREYMEAIAIHRGEEDEKEHLLKRFGAVIANWSEIMVRTKKLNAFTTGYSQVAVIFPFIVALPRYFAKSITLGGLMQVNNAFSQVQGALSWIISNYSGGTGNANITQLRAIVARLSTFQRAMAVARLAKDQGIIMQETNERKVTAQGLTLCLPSGKQLLVEENLTLDAGTNVVVTGVSGSGKSTLFRALAGIWPFGSGVVRRPAERCMFLPQRPYIPLGTLRRVVTFPNGNEAYSNEQVIQALTDVGLGRLATELDVDDAWTRRLSGGEQQRVAVARALLYSPDFLFLDEATASLDPASETALYKIIKERLPNTTIISIAHHTAVAQFHDECVQLQRTSDDKPGKLVRSKVDHSEQE